MEAGGGRRRCKGRRGATHSGPEEVGLTTAMAAPLRLVLASGSPLRANTLSRMLPLSTEHTPNVFAAFPLKTA